MNGTSAIPILLACVSLVIAALMPVTYVTHGKNLRSISSDSTRQSIEQELKRASQLLSTGRVDQAVVILRRITQADPQNPDAQLLLGTALALAPERTQALEAFRKAIELRPGFAPGYVALGMALARFGELEAAEQSFAKAVALDSTNVDAHISLGLLKAQRRDLPSARNHFEAALRSLGETHAAAYPRYLLAQVLGEQQQFALALKEIERAIKLRPDYSEAHLSHGLILKNLRDQPGALRAFMKAVELSPDDPKARYELGSILLLSNQVLPAIEHLQRSLELRPGDRLPMYHLCRALRRAGRHDDAKTCQKSLSEIIDGQLKAADLNAGKLNNEGVNLEQSGELAAALEKYSQAVNLDPLQPVFRRNLALVLCRLERWEEGIAELREVLELDPSDTEATRALYFALEKLRSGESRKSTQKP